MHELCENCGHFALQHDSMEPGATCLVTYPKRDGTTGVCECLGLLTESTM